MKAHTEEQKVLARTNMVLGKAAAQAGAALERIAKAEHTPAQAQKKKRKKKKKTAQVHQGVDLSALLLPGTSSHQQARQQQVNKPPSLRGSPYHDYLLTLARPFDVSNVSCPVSYNLSPSYIQTKARTTYTNLSLTVALNTTTQIVLFPGHLPSPGAATAAAVAANGVVANLDPVSNHCYPLTINATNVSIGPVTTAVGGGTPAGCIGTVTSAVGPGLSYNSTAAVATCGPLYYDTQLPYTGDGSVGGGHTRWQLVSMGIRVQNITNDLYRGGTMVSVQPNVSFHWADNTGQQVFERFPTFHDWGKDHGFELSWIPRTQDLAFWHTTTTPTVATYATNNDGAGIIVWLNAPADYPQTYSYEVVCNWQLAGNYLNTVGGPAPHHPGLKAPIEQTVSALLNSAPTANMAEKLGVQALKATGLTKDSIGTMMMSLGKDAVAAAAAGFIPK